MYNIAAQALGFIGMGFCTGCFLCKSSRQLLLCQMIGNLFFLIHFLMLGAYAGCVSEVIISFNNLLICISGRRWTKWKGWKWLLSGCVVLSCIATWDSLFSLMPCIATIIFILTNWTQNGKVIRLGKLLAAGPGWIIYGLNVHSYSVVISETMGMCSVLYSICRYGLKDLDRID